MFVAPLGLRVHQDSVHLGARSRNLQRLRVRVGRLQPTPLSMNRQERTFTAIKPDAVQRGLVGEIITIFERKGYKLVGLKLLRPDKYLAEQHYSELREKPFFPSLVDFICSGPVVAMCWEGKDVVRTARKLLGATNPLESDPGTIRGMYGIDIGRNVVHSSDAVPTAEREIRLWFAENELVNWDPEVARWIYE
jgi:nucleoside-diphosphate kinase